VIVEQASSRQPLSEESLMPGGPVPPAPVVTVVLVDDHAFFRDGVARGLSRTGRIRVVGTAEDGTAGLDLIRRETPDVALVDYQMPGLNGLDVVAAVARERLATRILLLSAVSDASVVSWALRHGACGYLSKDASRREIADGVIRVAGGDTVRPPAAPSDS
jgi:two-component system nitrate/nitrite response regulator NarL